MIQSVRRNLIFYLSTLLDIIPGFSPETMPKLIYLTFKNFSCYPGDALRMLNLADVPNPAGIFRAAQEESLTSQYTDVGDAAPWTCVYSEV